MWSGLMWIISFNLLNNTEVGSIITLIFQRRKKRRQEPSHLAKVTQHIGSVFLSHNAASPWGLAQSLASAALMTAPFPLTPGVGGPPQKVQGPQHGLPLSLVPLCSLS